MSKENEYTDTSEEIWDADNALSDAAVADGDADAADGDALPEEGHSDYTPTAGGEDRQHQLTGMFQTWFLDYASYVILERAVPHIGDGLKQIGRAHV